MNRDFDLKFTKHPVTGDVAMKTGNNALLQSVRNLVLTASGDWKAQQGIGVGVHRMLGENDIDVLTGVGLERVIREQLQTFEPRIELKDVSVRAPAGSNSLRVTVTFYEVNSVEPVLFEEYIKVLI